MHILKIIFGRLLLCRVFLHRVLSFILLITVPVILFSQERKKPYTFNASLELNSKYVWRGIPFGDSPVIFPTIGFQYKNLCVSAVGGYAFNGSHSEVDLFLTYTAKDFLIGLGDYFFPKEGDEKNNYLNFKRKETSHTVEAYITYAPTKLPVWVTASTYVYGDDRRVNGRNNYSTYFELGYYKCFSPGNKLSLILGFTPMSGYYSDSFNVVNTAVKYETYIPFNNYKLPVSGSFVLNPSTEKVFLTFSIYLTK